MEPGAERQHLAEDTNVLTWLYPDAAQLRREPWIWRIATPT